LPRPNLSGEEFYSVLVSFVLVFVQAGASLLRPSVLLKPNIVVPGLAGSESQRTAARLFPATLTGHTFRRRLFLVSRGTACGSAVSFSISRPIGA
jgi:hypothetical protein